jgi:hypothetical protein
MRPLPSGEGPVILGGDVGGTKTWLGIFRAGGSDAAAPLTLQRAAKYSSGTAAGLDQLVAEFLEDERDPVDFCCFGLPGPVRGNRVKLVNLPWDVDADALSARFGFHGTFLINDLVANAYGIGELAPRPEQVAKALARRGCQRLLVSGAYAANMLGLSDQVPARIEYLTDGPSQTVMIRNLPVKLKQTTPRRLAVADRVSGTVAEALRFLRQSQIDETVVAKLRKRLSDAERRQLIKDIPLVPAWIGEVFRKVGAGEK